MSKQEILLQITALLAQLIEPDEIVCEPVDRSGNAPIEMLTIKECMAEIQGLTQHTLRQLCFQNKLPYVRAGEGKRGKILIPKHALYAYFDKTA